MLSFDKRVKPQFDPSTVCPPPRQYQGRTKTGRAQNDRFFPIIQAGSSKTLQIAPAARNAACYGYLGAIRLYHADRHDQLKRMAYPVF